MLELSILTYSLKFCLTDLLGYTPRELNKTLLTVRNMNRDDLFRKKEAAEKDFGIAKNQVGSFSCGRCVMCKTSKHSEVRVRKTTEFTTHSSGESFKINKFITCGTCGTAHVTYLLSCPCGPQYVGRTTRALGVRLREHVNRIKKGFKHHSLSNHFRLVHRRDPSGLTFCGMDRIEGNWRGGNLK